MKKLLCAVLAVMMIMLAAAPAMAISIRGVGSGQTLYVNTASGRALNLRNGPSSTAKVIAKLSRGTAVIAGDDYQEPYLRVTVNGKKGWVDIRYLEATKPSKGSSSGGSSSSSSDGTLISKLSFKNFKLVDGVVVVTPKPPRVGSSVNLRWAPSTEASVLRRVYAGDQLTVVTEGKDWYQVQTEDGYVAFIAKKFTSVVYSGDAEGYAALQQAAAQ